VSFSAHTAIHEQDGVDVVFDSYWRGTHRLAKLDGAKCVNVTFCASKLDSGIPGMGPVMFPWLIQRP
jgi:hypothetical protein